MTTPSPTAVPAAHPLSADVRAVLTELNGRN